LALVANAKAAWGSAVFFLGAVYANPVPRLRDAFNAQSGRGRAWRYAGDPSTGVWCGAYAIDDGPVQIWTPKQPIPEEFRIAAADSDWLVVAHNDSFESDIEERLLGPRRGWPINPIERHRCTMAAALANALPGALDKAAAALELPVRKDAEGHRLMLAMAKPRKPRPGEDPNGIYWHDDPERIRRLRA